MIVFDASPLVDLFLASANSVRIQSVISTETVDFIVTDLAAGEFSAAVSRLVRTGALERDHAESIFALFDGWRSAETIPEPVQPADMRMATGFVRRFDLNLKLPDAIHIATALRLRASLCTFDRTQAAAARRIGVPVTEIP